MRDEVSYAAPLFTLIHDNSREVIPKTKFKVLSFLSEYLRYGICHLCHHPAWQTITNIAVNVNVNVNVNVSSHDDICARGWFLKTIWLFEIFLPGFA